MWVSLLLLALSLAATIGDFLGNDYDYDLQNTKEGIEEFQERQDSQNDIILPAFVATFIGSSLVNLLFPPATTTTTTTVAPPPPPPAPPTCQCGVEGTTRIVNGQETGINQYPWLVRIETIIGANGFACGGTIVASRYLISAAHCFFSTRVEIDANGNPVQIVDSYATKDSVTLRIADHDLTVGTTESKLPVKVVSGLENLFLHETWVASNQVGQPVNPAPFDIAVLELKAEDELDLTTYTPACLAKSTDRADGTFVGQKATVAGWGALSFGGNPPDPLVPHHVEMTVRDQCMVNGVDSPSDICAGDDDPPNDNGTPADTSDDTGKGSCQGDSGGPLTFKQPNGQHVLIGDVSRAVGCATPNENTLFGRISFLRDWIDDKMSNPVFCGGTSDGARRQRKFRKNKNKNKKKKNKRKMFNDGQ